MQPIMVRETGRTGNNDGYFDGLYDYGQVLYPYGDNWWTRPSFTDGVWRELDITITNTGILVKVDGTTVINDTSSGTRPNTFPSAKWWLFGLPDPVGAETTEPTKNNSRPLNGRMKKITVYDANTAALIADLRPCTRNSDSRVGISDIVSGEFSYPINEYGDVAASFTVGNINP